MKSRYLVVFVKDNPFIYGPYKDFDTAWEWATQEEKRGTIGCNWAVRYIHPIPQTERRSSHRRVCLFDRRK